MKQEFTDADIRRAADKAGAGMGIYASLKGREFLHDFLTSLPEPAQDDFQRGGVILDADDVRKGDRVLIRNLADNLYEVTVTAIDERAIIWKGSSITKSSIDRIYLLDRPVQHPDPEQHPVIYVKDCDLVNFIPEIMVWYRDSYVAGRQCLSPERITDWQQIDPAKVVAEDD